MNALQLIPLDRLKPRSNQVRREFHRIGELARSIELHTLLQNLVVRPTVPEGHFEIVAGERRYRALKLLQQEGRLKSTDIPCAVLGTDGFLENIVENVGREDVPLWDLGRTYVTLSRLRADAARDRRKDRPHPRTRLDGDHPRKESRAIGP